MGIGVNDAEILGKTIASLRKQRGATLEEVGNYVGVSAQAVSKWERGTVPDATLLPKIAKFFNVSIDSLFAREINNIEYLQNILMDKIAETPEEERISLIFNLCWDMERVLVNGRKTVLCSLNDMKCSIGAGRQRLSTVMCDHGFTRMGIGNRSQYFLIVPEAKNKGMAYLDGIDYTEIFRDLSDKAVFDCCVMLNQRENGKAFTYQLLINKLGITEDKAKEVICTLLKYHLLSATEIELNDEIHEVYQFIPTPSFVALLIFAREMIAPPRQYAFRYHNRSKPYLK